MDELDAAILRELFRDRGIIWGGGDPRLGTTDIADRLDVDRTTVWARLKAWREDGFLVRQEAVPNPALFGAGVAGGDIMVDDPRHKPEVLEAVQLVDGILTGVDLVGPWVVLLYAMESERALERSRQLLDRLPHVEEVTACIPFETPESAIELTDTDWRIVDALRRSPEAPFKEVAEQASVSPRTFTRRYRELLEASAIWSFPLFDFTRYQGAVLARFVVLVDGAGERADLVNACRSELDQLVWCGDIEPVLPEGASGPLVVEAWCHLASAPAVEEVELWLGDHAGVQEVLPFYPKSWFVVPTWFDERIERQMPAAQGPSR